MDYQKDTTPQGVDSKGQTPLVVDNNLENKEIFFDTLFKRTQKLLTALYMVTDCLEDGEPIKFRLRTLGVSLLSDMRVLAKERALVKMFRFEESKSLINEVVALVEVAGLVGIISSMNSAILGNELLLLKKSIEEKEELNKKSGFQDSFFASQGPNTAVIPEGFFSSFSEEKTNTEKQLPATPVQQKQNVKDNVLYQKQSKVNGQSAGARRPEGAVLVKDRQSDIALKINRRNNILRLIKDKKEVMIKDISTVISDCSEKTIQRELNTLVAEGVLKKKGSKRWSRYALS